MKEGKRQNPLLCGKLSFMREQPFRIPIGIDDFRKIRAPEENFLYCDKSLFARDILVDGAEVMLFTRPRRFGKTLNMSLLHYFLGGEDPSLFEGLKIREDRAFFEKHQGKYASIFFTMKELEATTLEEMLLSLSSLIQEVFKPYETFFRHPSDEIYFNPSLVLKGPSLQRSLYYLSETLTRELKKPVMILIDEYDAPLQNAYLNGFYDQLSPVIRALFGKTFKTNPYLKKGILTGVTRIAKENFFSGLNNFIVYGVDHSKYGNYFGFTEEEVKNLASRNYEELKSWYNGYTFGEATVYNPWSILNCIHNDYKCEAYWLGTGGTQLMEEAVTLDKLPSIHSLLDGNSIEIKMDPQIIFQDIQTNTEAFFNLLYVAGYLTSAGPPIGDFEIRPVRIPNREVAIFFKKTILKWFYSITSEEGRTNTSFLPSLMSDLIKGEVQLVQEKLGQLVLESFSFHDVSPSTQESFYHGFMMGLTLTLLDRYSLKSNRESGFGRYDIALYPKDPLKDPGIVIEVKIGNSSPEEAIAQMQEKAYYTDLVQYGCRNFHLYGLYFDGKSVQVSKA